MEHEHRFDVETLQIAYAMGIAYFLEQPDQNLHMILVVQILALNFGIRTDPVRVAVTVV